jgi:hypothetical protein
MRYMIQEELQGLIKRYEKRGFFDEVLQLLEAGLSLERAHVSTLFHKSTHEITKPYLPLDGNLYRALNSL